MKHQGRPASSTPQTIRWLASATVAAGLALAPAWAAAEIRSVSVDTANFRAGPSTDHPVLFSADRFYPVEIIDQKKDWVRIRDFEGDEAWVASWLLCDAKTIVVTRNVVNVRDKPTSRSTVVHTAERGAVFKWTGSKGSWLKVADEEGEIGWVHRNLVWGSTQDEQKASKKKPPKPKASPKKAPEKVSAKPSKAPPKHGTKAAGKAAAKSGE